MMSINGMMTIRERRREMGEGNFISMARRLAGGGGLVQMHAAADLAAATGEHFHIGRRRLQIK